MKFVNPTLSAALAAVFSLSAFAQDAGTDTSGSATANGAIHILSRSGAILQSHQNSGATVSPGATPTEAADSNQANLTSGAGNGVQGNIGVNVAAGAANMQSNEVALSAVDVDRVFARASTFSTQNSTATLTSIDAANNNAAINDALNGARGNVSVNVAAGDGNLQDNQLAAAVNSSGKVAKAIGENNQATTANIITGTAGTNAAGIGANALANAQGNIGANVTAGQGNLQYNSLSIAAATR